MGGEDGWRGRAGVGGDLGLGLGWRNGGCWTGRSGGMEGAEWMEGPNRTNRTAQTKLQEEPNRNQSKTHPRNRNEPKRTAALLTMIFNWFYYDFIAMFFRFILKGGYTWRLKSVV